MKKLIKIFIVVALILAAAFITPLLIKDPGYFLIRFAGYEIEMRFVVALALVLVFIFLLWLLVYFIRLPKKTLKNISTNHSRKSFAKGLLALSEGKWKQAEKHLIISAKNSPTPELSYMAAARAAIAQNKIDQAFIYLDKAENSTDNPLTVDLTRCELWIKTGDNEKAIELLNRILKSYPNNPRALHLMTQACQNSGQWQRLREILPKVEKLEILNAEKTQLLTQQSILQQINQCESESQLLSVWNSLNKQQKLDFDNIYAYARVGQKLGMNQQVAQLAEETLNKSFSDGLLLIWSQLDLDAVNKIKLAEKWLKKHPNNPLLLRILGQLCLENKLWGKAQNYLQKSLELNPDSTTFKLMAHYFDAVGEADNALEAYRQSENNHAQLILVDESSSEGS
jgi:HemY protein